MIPPMAEEVEGGGLGEGGEEGAGEVKGRASSWGWGGYVNAFLTPALARVIRAVVPIPTVVAASVLHSAAVGGSNAGVVGAL